MFSVFSAAFTLAEMSATRKERVLFYLLQPFLQFSYLIRCLILDRTETADT
jgi:hypothetical protein